MSKNSKLKKILLGSTGLIGATVGGLLSYFVYTPGTVDLSREKYTFAGAIVGGLMGSYLYYSSKNKK